jgi:hypothetical protein
LLLVQPVGQEISEEGSRGGVRTVRYHLLCGADHARGGKVATPGMNVAVPAVSSRNGALLLPGLAPEILATVPSVEHLVAVQFMTASMQQEQA